MEWLACLERGESGGDIPLIQCHFLIEDSVPMFLRICIMMTSSYLLCRTFFSSSVTSTTCYHLYIFLLINAVDMNR